MGDLPPNGGRLGAGLPIAGAPHLRSPLDSAIPCSLSNQTTNRAPQVRLNGKYYGKFAFTEKWSADALAHNGYTVAPQPGPLMKSESGEYGNLRWDIPSDQVQFYYSDEFKTGPSAAAALVDLGRGLAGGGGVPRSKFLFDAVDLPRTINQLAAQTVVLNQDRCTKNFLVYRDPSSRQWSMLPWDVESAFTNDRGLGGGPAADYCSLACEQVRERENGANTLNMLASSCSSWGCFCSVAEARPQLRAARVLRRRRRSLPRSGTPRSTATATTLRTWRSRRPGG